MKEARIRTASNPALDALLSVIYELAHPASAEFFMDANNDYLYASKHNK
ncbi:hypothetical protein SAMN05660380_01550 [Xylella fastidiosa]|jgi:hypothetical protein|uniref:Uncharacterized protein n=1 Tax=Xylella fastidiosa (strain M23) TaxID=405441 RepID=B2IAL8_XYLF2|nr:hypothetical protein XfasM23_0865 [Xylella fastidiosa M23]AIC13665.1 hypothetical protein P303_04240 [Xylella fastidiosa MUL0034]SHG83664.1 hypothetical protein SAMN05660380_01550 [Xylella fastidiosa]